jgi:hypothetical protein
MYENNRKKTTLHMYVYSYNTKLYKIVTKMSMSKLDHELLRDNLLTFIDDMTATRVISILYSTQVLILDDLEELHVRTKCTLRMDDGILDK